MVLLCSFYSDVALKFFAGLVQAGHAGKRRNCRMHRTAKIKRTTIVRYIPQKYLRLSTVVGDYLCYQWLVLGPLSSLRNARESPKTRAAKRRRSKLTT